MLWGAFSLFCLGLWLWMREHQGKRKEAQLRHAFAEQQNQRIPLLEAALKQKEEECSHLLTEQRIAEEKLQILLRAEEQLKNVFRSFLRKPSKKTIAPF